MTQLQLEKRLHALERDVADLKQRVAKSSAATKTGGWRRTVGMFSGDRVMNEIMNEALRYREQDRAKVRRTARKARAKA